MKSLFVRFAQDESGAAAIEYALIALIIGLGILVGAHSVKNALDAKYGAIASDVAALP